ncbi:Hypothetical protein, putative [Bodo saltans]|uniref:WW domain-containing protein n=1 Tax=Bodo saltans TaxID=75058 RepID=A0A0S4JIR2_BODSA|nr:Hypothetical protein, putative [Bodo saltans]|eukprot:CUG91428.1 Hypothetical protein, putative [Bodo saltans]
MKGIVSGAISLPGSSSKDKPPSASEDATQSTGAAASAAPVQRAPSNEDFSRARSEASSAGVAMSPNDKDLPRPPIRGTSVASTAHTDATSEPPPSAPPSESASRREGSEAPSVAAAAAPPAADSLTIKKMEAKHNASMRDLERRLIQAEGTISDMSRESKLLREQLFDRDGPKSVQHLVNLQREAMHLRVELDKERDSVAYHRTAHMQALEEVARLKKKFDTHGDHRALLEAKQTLLQQVADLIRSKTQLELRVSELEDSQLCLDKDEAQLNAAKRQGHVSSSLFVHCRRATLCDKCRDMISVLEQRLEFEASIRVNSFRQRDLVEDIVPPMLSQKWHRDPTSYVAPVVSGTVPGTHRSVPSAPETVYGQSPSWRGAKGWRMLRSLDGGIVYHNIITNQSTLERPAELYPDIF